MSNSKSNSKTTFHQKSKQHDSYNIPIEDSFLDLDDHMNVVSSTECTGLIPSGIMSEEELDFYQDLYPYSPVDIPDGPND